MVLQQVRPRVCLAAALVFVICLGYMKASTLKTRRC